MSQSQANGTASTAPMTAEEKKAKMQHWASEQFVKIQKFCFTNGIEFKGFNQQKCLTLPPSIGIWNINTAKKGEEYWGISGDFPTDIAPLKVAKNARDATRYFSMSWHLKAARMEDALAEGKINMGDKETQQKIIIDLIQKAETLAAIHQDDNLWANTNLKAG